MCGIVAVLPSYDPVLLDAGDIGRLIATLAVPKPLRAEVEPDALRVELAVLDAALLAAIAPLARAGVAAAVLAEVTALSRLTDAADALLGYCAELDRRLDDWSVGWDAEITEAVQLAMRKTFDSAYALRHDRVEPLRRMVRDVPGVESITASALVGYLALDRVLGALDNLEVRGRDSAGLSVWIDLSPGDLITARASVPGRRDPLLQSGSVRDFEGGLAFVYKRAAIVGKLGENVSHLRAAISADAHLHRVLALPSAQVNVLAHTRWASIGRISEANAHPVDNWLTASAPSALSFAVLNGDIDNHPHLRRLHELGDDDEITTDAKVVPVHLAEWAARRRASLAMVGTIADFEGSMAIAAQLSQAPGRLLLAVKGSGQGLYVGLAETGFIVASEVYGLAAVTRDYVRLDGGLHADATQAGTVVELGRVGSGSLSALTRLDADGRVRPMVEGDIRTAELTTRDLALDGAQHYLQKEIGQAAAAFRKTLRGRVRVTGETAAVELPDSSVPAALREQLRDGRIRRIAVIGQGTAAVASQGIAQVMASVLGGDLRVRATPATEFSAYDLAADLSDTLIVAISQSGSTTDTNRAVDLARDRGARVVAIINRRDSDLAAKAHGVLYTSDGRDVEMSVASTKAFYAQVAAGCLLALQLAEILGVIEPTGAAALLQALHDMPGQLQELQQTQADVARVADATVTRHQNWSVVGSGPNRVAAAEARIKLSELCYRAVSTDALEDKKHIDLSAESLVLVCATGTPPGQLRDIQKEVEILVAHHNVPIVISDAETTEGWATPHIIRVPAAHPVLAWILSTAAAHLFAYYAAKAIDACAEELRTALGLLDDTSVEPTPGGPSAARELLTHFVERVCAGEIVGVLSPSAMVALTVAAADLTSPALGAPTWFADHSADREAFTRAALTAAISELTRPIDSVKHQAKTITVGTSRDDADLHGNDITRTLQLAGCDTTAALGHATLMMMREYSPLVTDVLGVARYRVRGRVAPEIKVVHKAGVATGLVSRSEQWSPLTGTKELVARSRAPRLLRGASDGRLVLVVPEHEGATLSGVAVVHLELAKTALGPQLLAALSVQSGRVDELRAAITEGGVDFEPELLEQLAVEDVLLAPAETIAAILRMTA